MLWVYESGRAMSVVVRGCLLGDWLWEQGALEKHKGLRDDELKGGVVGSPSVNQGVARAADVTVLDPGVDDGTLVGGDGDSDFDEVKAGVDKNQRLSLVVGLQGIPLGALNLFGEVGSQNCNVVVHGFVGAEGW